ncbi:MAG TPA: hypothetical protein VNB29_08555 [Chthoniobacterales bacterium]|nr:hypothetical protein [Chthoniobacterales bacterium]
MKSLARFAAVAAIALSVPLAGAATKEDSLISAFAGPHNGSLNFLGVFGSTTGNFKASKKKETGTLTLQSFLSGGGSSLTFNEQLSFNKRRVTWNLSEDFGGGVVMGAFGVGTASIKKNVITYSIPFSASGTPGFLTGTIKLAKNGHLAVQESISIGGTSASLIYQLGGKKPKK